MWVVLTLSSALCGALTKLLERSMLKETLHDTFAFSFLFQMVVAGLFLVLALVTQQLRFELFPGMAFHLVAMVLCYAVANLATFSAFKETQASEVSLLLSSSAAWSVLSAVVFLHERLTSAQVSGIVLLLVGVAVIQVRRSGWHVRRGHVLAVLAAVLFGIAFTNDVFILKHVSSISTYMVLAFSMPALLTLGFRPQAVKRVVALTKWPFFGKLLVTAVLYAASAWLIFSAYRVGAGASLIAPLHQTSLLFTVALSYLLLDERDHLPQKVIGTGLAFVGALLLI